MPSPAGLPRGVNRYTAPLARPKKENLEPTDWVKIGAIAAAIIGGLIAGLSTACILGHFPLELLGGTAGTGITFIIGATILAPAALVLFDKWQNPDSA